MATSDRYEKLARFQMSEAALNQHSYPRPHPHEAGKAQISNAQSKYRKIPSQHTRTCKRCKIIYSVDKDGKALDPSECSYHPDERAKAGKPYRCCYRSMLTGPPCKTAPEHVTEDIDMDNLTGFIETKNNGNVTAKEAYAVDTEMIFTYGGLEVAALSIVDTNCDVVYETLIIPDNPVIDYNTYFSDLKASDFQNVTATMKDVHSKFRELFGPETILVGHGLANDLIGLRVIHDRVVDTLDAFPHKRGLPFLNSLKYLKDRYLPFEDQPQFSGPYKCRADAVAAMKLALKK